MARYKSKPEIVNATQWFKWGDHPRETSDPAGGPIGDNTPGVMCGRNFVQLRPGDWIVTANGKGIRVYSDADFKKLYEPDEFDEGFDNCN